MLSLAGELAKRSFGGEFIALFGGLGAGKTTFVRGFCSALGMDAAASPTFTIVRHYEAGGASVFHFDCYRLADSEELISIGFDDYLSTGSIILMEWSENVIDALPEERLEVHISGSGNDARTVELVPVGERLETIVQGVRS